MTHSNALRTTGGVLGTENMPQTKRTATHTSTHTTCAKHAAHIPMSHVLRKNESRHTPKCVTNYRCYGGCAKQCATTVSCANWPCVSFFPLKSFIDFSTYPLLFIQWFACTSNVCAKRVCVCVCVSVCVRVSLLVMRERGCVRICVCVWVCVCTH